MPRSYRHIFFALVGWLSLANAQSPSTNAQQPKAEANQAQPAPAPTLPPVQPVEPVESGELYRPCEEGQDARNSDLCAQWKAADAARDAADWTYWGVLLGIVGTIGLFWTLYYTRAAVKAAQEATKDADDAIEIARTNARAATDLAATSREAMENDLRAWIGVSCEVSDCRYSDFGFTASVEVQLRNYGKSPAPVAEVTLITYARTSMATGGAPVRRAFQFQPFEPVMPDDSSSEKFALTFEPDQLQRIIAIAQEERSGVILGFRAICKYATVFDDRRIRPRVAKVAYTIHPKIEEGDTLFDNIHWITQSHARNELNVWTDFAGLNRLA
jgi:hypothetical protein